MKRESILPSAYPHHFPSLVFVPFSSFIYLSYNPTRTLWHVILYNQHKNGTHPPLTESVSHSLFHSPLLISHPADFDFLPRPYLATLLSPLEKRNLPDHDIHYFSSSFFALVLRLPAAFLCLYAHSHSYSQMDHPHLSCTHYSSDFTPRALHSLLVYFDILIFGCT
jgi:hypothetical protein